MTPNPKNLQLAQEFEEAVMKYAFKGAGHPEDIPYIVLNYHRAKQHLYRALRLPYEFPENLE